MAEKRNGRVVVSISDDGPGFDPGEHEAVFEPGARGSAPRNVGAPEGTGLGVSLARRLARAVGADVRIAPSPVGGRVEVVFPSAGAVATAAGIDA